MKTCPGPKAFRTGEDYRDHLPCHDCEPTKETKEAYLERTLNELVRGHGVVNVIRAVIAACDNNADFAHQCNDKSLEHYWRSAAVSLFDSMKRIGDSPEKSKKY